MTRVFADHGHRVFALVRKPDAQPIREVIRSYPEQIIAIKVDVRDAESVAIAAQQVAPHAPDGIDIVVNNAGILLSREVMEPRKFAIEELHRTIDTNTVGPLRVVQAFLDLLEKRVASIAAHENAWRPRVVNVSSVMGSVASVSERRNYSYSVSKAALNMLTRIIAFDLKELGIDAFLVHPGWVRTEMGGPAAHFSEEESANGLYRQILGWTSGDAEFIDFRGSALTW